MKIITKNIYLVWAFCCLFAFGVMGQTVTPQGPTSTPPPAGAGGGGGSGTVNPGTTPQVAYYATTSSAVSPNPVLQFNAGETTFNDSGANIDTRIATSSQPFLVFADAGLHKLGIGNGAPIDFVDIVSTGTSLSTGQYSLNVTGILPTSTFTEHGVRFDIDAGFGSGVGGHTGQTVAFTGAGLTSTGPTIGFQVINTVPTTGNNLELNTSFINPSGNSGLNAFAVSTTTGANLGAYNEAAGGNLNIGMIGKANVAKTNTTNIGVLGIGNNTLGGTGFQLGGYFGLQNATPTFASGAIVGDNGATTSPMLLLRDNGAASFTVVDGGQVQTVTGTAAIPAIGMGDTNSGFFGGADVLGMSINGTQEIQLTATVFSPISAGGSALGTTGIPFTNVNVQTGSAATPAVTMGDTNSGIFGGADLVNFVINGTQETVLNATAFSPFAAGGLSSGTTTLPWSTVNTQAGTAAAPAHTMGDTNSGIFGGADVVNFSIGGVQETVLNATAFSPFANSGLSSGTSALAWNQVISNGGSSAPAFAMGGNIDTGLYYNGTTTVGLSLDNAAFMDLQAAQASITTSVGQLQWNNAGNLNLSPNTPATGTAGGFLGGSYSFGSTANTMRGTVPTAIPSCAAGTSGLMVYKEDTDSAGTNSQLCLCARNNGALTYSWIAIGGSLTGTCT